MSNTDLDKSGQNYQKTKVYLGPTLGWVDIRIMPETIITTGGTHTLQPDVSVVLVDVEATTTLNLPDVRLWMNQAYGKPSPAFDRCIAIKDFGGHAFDFNITVHPFGGQRIDGIAADMVLNENFQYLAFWPLNDLSGWYVETNVSVTLPGIFTDITDGFTPASGGGTDNFLRADGTWAPPVGTPSLIVYETVAAAEAATVPANIDMIETLGYNSVGDKGGALYKRVATQPPHEMFIETNNGAFFEYFPGPEGVNANVAGLVGDDSTDNLDLWKKLWYFRKTYGRKAKRVCTITIAAPGVVTLLDHAFRANEAVVLSTTGALPTGLVAGTVYYVSNVNMTRDTFSLGAKNAYPPGGGQDGITPSIPAPITTSGSQSGVHSIARCSAADKLILQPGNYLFSANAWATGNSPRTHLSAYGATAVFGGGTLNYQGFVSTYPPNYEFQTPKWATLTANVNAGNTVLNVALNGNGADYTAATFADDFFPGTWCLLGALDVQNPWHSLQSWPPNLQFFEFVQIKETNPGANTITLWSPLRQGYRTWYPQFWDGGSNAPASGPAILYPMNSDWDQETVIEGITNSYDPLGGQIICSNRYIRFKDCLFNGQGPVPSWSKYYEMDNCKNETFGQEPGQMPEIDKLIDQVVFKNCTFASGNNSSPSVNKLVLDNVTIFNTQNGTARQTHIKESHIGTLMIGPLIGVADNLLVENSIIENPEAVLTFNEQFLSRNTQAVNNFTIVDGILKRPITFTGMNAWAIPGAHGFVRDYNLQHTSMGSPFQIIDVFKDGSDNFCIETDLTALPVGPTTQATVTITIASPAVIGWAAHGLPADTPIVFNTTGALPTGILALQNSSNIYYVSATGLNVNDFQISATVGGASINTSGSQSGTHTAYANPLKFSVIGCPRVTFRNVTGSARSIEISQAPAELPYGSFMKRRYQANMGGSGIQNTYQPVHGKLVYVSINVLKAYTGGAGTMNFTLSFNAFNNSIIAANQTFIINTFNVGKRLITPTSATGAQAGDTIAAADVWISGRSFSVTQSASSGADDPGMAPLVELEILTNQGTYSSGTVSVFGGTAQEPNQFVWVDTMRGPLT